MNTLNFQFLPQKLEIFNFFIIPKKNEHTVLPIVCLVLLYKGIKIKIKVLMNSEVRLCAIKPLIIALFFFFLQTVCSWRHNHGKTKNSFLLDLYVFPLLCCHLICENMFTDTMVCCYCITDKSLSNRPSVRTIAF